MKAIVSGIALLAMTLGACSSNSDNSNGQTAKKSDTAQTATTPPAGTTVDQMLSDYLEMKNALTSDDGTAAASAGKKLAERVAAMDTLSFSTEQQKMFSEVKDDIKEHAEHISANAGKIEHQREHFQMLSKDMYDLAKLVKPTQTLYVDHCPMYNKGKGADWLSEAKEIKNPYLGKEMPDCGTVKEELKK